MTLGLQDHHQRNLRPTAQPRVIGVAEMPFYAPELHQIVAAVLADLPPELVLLTYKSVQKHFGVSRATVARRLKEGVVPGVRILDGHVLDDGAVRRFDRTQLHWLLLAVRFAKAVR